jgi:broad specificity phosphatase PhoE
MTILYLLRHGPTQASASGAPLGQRDWPVSVEGAARWPGVRAVLGTLGLHRVLCSSLQRSLLHAQDLGLPCTILDDLREQSFGAWDGIPWADLGMETTAAFFSDPVHTSPPGGESFAQCAQRALAAVDDFLIPDEPPTLILAHGGPLRTILAHLMGLPLERAVDVDWKPFGLSRIDIYAPHRGVLGFHNQALPEAPGHGFLEA